MSNIKFGLQLELQGDQVVVRGLENARGEVQKFTGEVNKSTQQTDKASRANEQNAKTLNMLKVAVAGVAAAAIGGLFTSMLREQEQLQRNMLRTEQLIRSTGAAAGFTAEQMHEQARGLAFATLQSTEGVMQAQQVMMTFRKVTGDTFTRSIELAADLATVTGTDLKSSVTQLGKALEDPVQGINAMTRSGVSFTQAQKDVIKSMVETGDVAGAQKLILDELAGQYGGVAKAEALGLAGAHDTLAQSMQEAKIAAADYFGLGEKNAGLVNALAIEVQAMTSALLGSGEAATAASNDFAGTHTALGTLFNLMTMTAIEFQDLGDYLGYFAARTKLVAEQQLALRTLQWEKAEAIARQIHEMDMLRAENRLAAENRIIEVIAARESQSKKLRDELAASQEAAQLAKVNSELTALLNTTELFGFAVAESAAETKEDTKAKKEAEKAAQALEKAQDALFKALFPVEAKQKEISEQLKLLEQWYAKNTDQVDKYREAKAKLQQQLHELNNPHEKVIANLKQETEALQRELAAMMAGEAAHRAYNREKAIEVELRRHNVAAGSPEEAMLRREIEARYDAADALTEYSDKLEASKRAQEEANRVADQFITEIVGNFASGVDDIGDYFANLWKRIKQEFINSGVAQLLGLQAPNTPLISGFGQMLGVGGAGGGGGLGNLMSLASTGKSLWTGVTGLLGANPVDSLMVPAHMLTREAAQQTAALTNSVNTWGPILAGVGGAIMGWQSANKLNAITGAAGGYFGAQGGAALGTAILPGIGTAIGAALGALLGSTLGSKVFGGEYETTRGGIQLGFDAEQGFNPQAYQRQTKVGGWGSSTKRRMLYDDLDPELDALVTSAYTTTIESIALLYGQIGVGVADGALEGVRIATLNIGTSGKSEQTQEEIEAQIGQWFIDLANALVSSIDAELDAETLTNLAQSLTGVNAIFSALRLESYDLSKAGAELALALVEMAGGLDVLAAASDFYYQNFYTEQERAQHALDEFNAMIAAFNTEFGTAIQSKDDLRAYVEQISASGAMATEAGMQAYLAAMNLAPALVGAANAMDVLAQNVAVVEEALSAGRINTLTDIASTALGQYNTRLADRASIEAQLAKVNADIEKTLARMAGNGGDLASQINPLPGIVDSVATAVDSLAYSSGQLRGWASSLLGLVNQLTLSDLSPLTNKQRLLYAQGEYAAAQVKAEETGDFSGLQAAAQAYIRENANYYANNPQGVQNFEEVVAYLSKMGVSLDGQADQAETAERAQERAAEAQRQATEALRASQQEAATKAQEDARVAREQAALDLLLQEQQRLELALQTAYAVDADAILEAQLQALVDTSTGIDTLADLLGILPQELAAALGGVIGLQPQDYGSTLNIVERLYKEVLGRDGDTAGVAYWEAYKQSAQSIDQLVSAFYSNAVKSGETPRISQTQFMNSFATGTAFVTHDQVAQIHREEIIFDAESSNVLRKYGIRASADSPQLLAALNATKGEIAGLRADMRTRDKTATVTIEKHTTALQRLALKLGYSPVEVG